MRLIWARRLSQGFFLGLFIWFVVVSTLGDQWWQLRGWPVNWFLQLDPLLALTSTLATGVLYAGLAWALVTVGLTLLLGRFFCGWVCPLGVLNQVCGWLAWRGRPGKERIKANRPSGAQAIKYYVLVVVLAAAVGDPRAAWLRAGQSAWWPLAAMGLGLVTAGVAWRVGGQGWKNLVWLGGALVGWLGLSWFLHPGAGVNASLLSGLLDPLPFLYRGVNLSLQPWVHPAPRFYQGAWFIALTLGLVLGLNALRPRFFCRFVCPLGALFGVLARLSPARLDRVNQECRGCLTCEKACEGGCAPSGDLAWGECVLCLNCLDTCPDSEMVYGPEAGAAGVRPKATADPTRRGLLWSLAAGAAAAPALRLGGGLAGDWPAQVVRPPGALGEAEFLARCTRCGQCMRVCPSGVIQPAALEAGLEGLWTPVLNFRIGTAGCLLNCVACGHLCPTAAIRPLSLDEKLGRGEFKGQGPIRLGTAFIERGRCLPWAMDRPCIVCQENCPVSPKAIFTRPEWRTLRGGAMKVRAARGTRVELEGEAPAQVLGGGDYYLRPARGAAVRIAAREEKALVLSSPLELAAGEAVEVQVRLQLPQVDPAACIGCGACEHECPVSGRRAIRVFGENQSRHPEHSLLLKAGPKASQ